jgi:hypothetical protein
MRDLPDITRTHPAQGAADQRSHDGPLNAGDQIDVKPTKELAERDSGGAAEAPDDPDDQPTQCREGNHEPEQQSSNQKDSEAADNGIAPRIRWVVQTSSARRHTRIMAVPRTGVSRRPGAGNGTS